MTYGSLFTGIAGLDLAVEEVLAARALWQAEMDLAARRVLAEKFPGVHCYRDVREIDETAPPPDIICGGFPCQDISDAGKKTLGIHGSRSGLWGEFARIVGALQPWLVFIENVGSLAIRGLDVVLRDLAALGFDAEWEVVRASDVGAPHRRGRIFILAYASGEGRRRAADALLGRWSSAPIRSGQAEPDGRGLDVADADGAARDERGAFAGCHLGTEGEVGSGMLEPQGHDPVADADGRGQRAIERNLCAGQPDAGGGGAGHLADADSGRREGERLAQLGGLEGPRGGEPDGRRHGGYVHVFPPGPARIAEWDGPQPAVRRGDARIPFGLDRGWSTKNGTPDRLRLLGNACVPQQAALALRTLLARAAGGERAA